MTTVTVLPGSDVWRIHNNNTTQSGGTAVYQTVRFDSYDGTTLSGQANAILAEHDLAIIYMTIGKTINLFAPFISVLKIAFSRQQGHFDKWT